MIIDNGKHYLYRHIRVDKDEPFYIGIGTKQDYKNPSYKVEYTRSYSKHHRGRIWKNITNKTEYIVEILLESDDYEFIKNKERELITLYGRIDINTGILSNLTEGGEGVRGAIRTEEWKRKIADKNRGKTRRKGYVWSEESKRKNSEAQKGRKLTEEHIAKIKYNRQFQVFSEETREKKRIAQTGVRYSDDVKKKMSESAKVRGVSKAFRDVCKKAVVQYTKSGEFIAEYESMSDANRATGVAINTMTNHCTGKVKTMNTFVKFIWKWKEETNK